MKTTNGFPIFCVAVIVAAAIFAAVILVAQQRALADEPQVAKTEQKETDSTPEGLIKLSPTHDVWIDKKRRAVIADGQVCLRQGQLEMFACTRGSKEHESVVSLNCEAFEVHSALLVLGAKPGNPVSFDPEYKPASGQIIDVYVLWKDEDGKKHQARAQDWVRDVKKQKPMQQNWVFAGSRFSKDEETGKEQYAANGGDLICVSNFTTAMLDVPIQSSKDNADLMFDANTDQIPPRGTNVRVVLIPRQPTETPEAKPSR